MGKVSQEQQPDPNSNPLSHPTLDSIREAWIQFGRELSPASPNLTDELEEYLRTALFQMSAIVYKLKAAGLSSNCEDAQSVGLQLEKGLRVCEQVSLFALDRCRSVLR